MKRKGVAVIFLTTMLTIMAFKPVPPPLVYPEGYIALYPGDIWIDPEGPLAFFLPEGIDTIWVIDKELLEMSLHFLGEIPEERLIIQLWREDQIFTKEVTEDMNALYLPVRRDAYNSAFDLYTGIVLSNSAHRSVSDRQDPEKHALGVALGMSYVLNGVTYEDYLERIEYLEFEQLEKYAYLRMFLNLPRREFPVISAVPKFD